MAAVILPMQFITALEWDLPWEKVPTTKTHDAYLARLKELADTGKNTPSSLGAITAIGTAM